MKESNSKPLPQIWIHTSEHIAEGFYITVTFVQNTSHLYTDFLLRFPPVENGFSVKFRISIFFKDACPYSVPLTPNDSIYIWNCETE